MLTVVVGGGYIGKLDLLASPTSSSRLRSSRVNTAALSHMADPTAQRKLSDSAGPAAAGQGYLSTLGVSFEADAENVKKEFRRMSLIYHPDKQAVPDTKLTDKFQACAIAYQVLQDESSRRAYMNMYRIVRAATSNASDCNPWQNQC